MNSTDEYTIPLKLRRALHHRVVSDSLRGDTLVRVGIVRPLLEVQPVRVRHRPPDAIPEGILKAERRNPAHLLHLLA